VAVAADDRGRMEDLDIRRPDLEDVRRAGTVRWYKDEKGLRPHHRVSFMWRGGVADHGRHVAESVRLDP
jgi:hypothetical protein